MIFQITEKVKEYLMTINNVFIDQKHEQEEEEWRAEEEIKETFRGMIADTKVNY